jgi:hypothetical protein
MPIPFLPQKNPPWFIPVGVSLVEVNFLLEATSHRDTHRHKAQYEHPQYKYDCYSAQCQDGMYRIHYGY